MAGTGWRRAATFGVLAALLVSAAGCADEPKSKRPKPSEISVGARTCADDGASCTESGELRWSLPLPGQYRLDASFDDFLLLQRVALKEEGERLGLFATDDTVYLSTGPQLLAIDAATGELRWTHREAGTSATTIRMQDSRLLVSQETLGDARQYLSVDPRTGDSTTIALREFEDDLGAGRTEVGDVPSGELILAAGGLWNTGEAGVRSVDPRSGKLNWRVRLGQYWQRTVRDGVVYADDYRTRKNVLTDGEPTAQTRAIQRVDIRSGKRLPDIELPRELWGKHHVAYVTGDGTIVLADPPADGGAHYAIDQNGRTLDEVPDDDRTSSSEDDEQEARVSAVGPSAKANHLVAQDASGAKRWTGPAMLGPGSVLLTNGQPRVAVTVACAPDGVRNSTLTDPVPGTMCTKPRVFAVTW